MALRACVVAALMLVGCSGGSATIVESRELGDNGQDASSTDASSSPSTDAAGSGEDASSSGTDANTSPADAGVDVVVVVDASSDSAPSAPDASPGKDASPPAPIVGYCVEPPGAGPTPFCGNVNVTVTCTGADGGPISWTCRGPGGVDGGPYPCPYFANCCIPDPNEPEGIACGGTTHSCTTASDCADMQAEYNAAGLPPAQYVCFNGVCEN